MVMLISLQSQTQSEAPSPFTPVSQGGLQRKCACGGSPGPTGECAECRGKRKPGLQTKLRVSQPGDRYEREADRVVEQVMRKPERDGATPASLRLQRLDDGSGYAGVEAPPIVDDVLRAPGRPLDAGTQSFMESRFGHDFSAVRVHTDGWAAASARAVGARAYTVGRDVVFGTGEYHPAQAEDRRLLAHELTHVIQQGGGAAERLQRKPTRVNYPGRVVDIDSMDEETRKRLGFEAVRACRPDQSPRESLSEKKKNCPVILEAGTPVTVMQEVAGDEWLFVEHPPATALGGQHYGYVPGAFVKAVASAKPAVGKGAPGTGKAAPRYSPERFEAERDMVLQQLARRRVELERQRMKAKIGHLQVDRGVLGGEAGGGPAQMAAQAIAEPVKDELLAVAEALEQLEREIEGNPLYTFVEGLVDGVRTNLSSEVYANNVDTFAKLAAYWTFSPALRLAFLEGTARGVKKEIEGFVELVTEFDEVWEQVKGLAQAIISEGGAEVTRALGYQVGSEAAKRLTEIGGITDPYKLAAALGETFGPLLLEIALGIATAGSSATASVSARMASLLARYPRLAKFLKVLRKLRSRGKKAAPDAPKTKASTQVPDKAPIGPKGTSVGVEPLAPQLEPPPSSQGSSYSLSNLDEFGRPGVVEAVINPRHLEPGKRPSTPRNHPAGTELGIGYDMTHLGAHELGFPTIPRNLTTASRQTNRFFGPRKTRPPTMRRVEMDVMKAIREGQTVRYRVTPIYVGRAPYPSAFHIQASGSGPNGIWIDTVIRNWTHHPE